MVYMGLSQPQPPWVPEEPSWVQSGRGLKLNTRLFLVPHMQVQPQQGQGFLYKNKLTYIQNTTEIIWFIRV